MLIQEYEAEAISASQTEKMKLQTQQLIWAMMMMMTRMRLAWSEVLQGRHVYHVECIGLAHF